MSAWQARGLCHPERLASVHSKARPDDWFAKADTPAYRRALSVCAACPVINQCAFYAESEGIPDGIWGGVGPAERKRAWEARGLPTQGWHLEALYDLMDKAIERRYGAAEDDSELEEWETVA